MTLRILELGDLCARMRAVNLDLFTELGTWATVEPAGPTQRWFTTACHRHAWHADLWTQRTPTIPESGVDDAAAAHRTRRLPEQPDAAVYREQLARITAELDEVLARLDRDLDPSTSRTITLVRHDLAELAGA